MSRSAGYFASYVGPLVILETNDGFQAPLVSGNRHRFGLAGAAHWAMKAFRLGLIFPANQGESGIR